MKFFSKGSLVAALLLLTSGAIAETKEMVATVTTKQKVRRCTNINANPNCHYVVEDVPTFRALVDVRTGDGQRETSFCVSELYERLKLTELSGCYTESELALEGRKLFLDNPSCGEVVYDEFSAFLDPGQSKTRLYKVVGHGEKTRLRATLGAQVRERAKDSFEPFHPELTDYEFYGPSVRDGDVSCQQQANQSSLDPSITVTCTNHSQQKLFVGDAYTHGSRLRIHGCNYFRP